MNGGGPLATCLVMAISFAGGMLAGVADWLSDLTANMTPAAASLLGTLAVGVFSVCVSQAVRLLIWWLDRKGAPARGEVNRDNFSH